MCLLRRRQFLAGQCNSLSGGGALGVAFVEPLLCDAPILFGVGADLVEPVRYSDPPLRHAGGDGRCEGAALDGGGDVGAVGEQDGFEHGPCFGEVVGVGDDQGEVLALTAGHCHVQAARVVALVARVRLRSEVSPCAPGSVVAYASCRCWRT